MSAAGQNRCGQPGRWRRIVKSRVLMSEEKAEINTVMKSMQAGYPQRAGRVDLVIERAKAMGVNGDPVVRQEIAKLLTLSK